MRYAKQYNRVKDIYGTPINEGTFKKSVIKDKHLCFYCRYDGFKFHMTKNSTNIPKSTEYDFVINNMVDGSRHIYFMRYKAVPAYKSSEFDFERIKIQLSKIYTNANIIFSDKSIHNAPFIYAARYNGSSINVDKCKSEYDFKYALFFEKKDGKNVVDKIIVFR